MMPNLETLRLLWWAILGILLIGFAIYDGFDFGIAAIYKLVARTDKERRNVLATFEPVWEGNQVWFILSGGAAFAAWPMLYAISFSSLYFAMFILLVAFIFRPVSFKYRNKVSNLKWRNTWDSLIILTGIIPSLLFGVAIGNVMQGLPFSIDSDLHARYTGDFIELINTFSLLCGLLSLSMFIMHGCQYLALKTQGAILNRANKISRLSSVLVIALFCLGGFLVKTEIYGFIITSPIDPFGPSNPLHKEVTTAIGAWFNNFTHYPALWIMPSIGFIGALLVFIFSSTNLCKLRLFFSALSQTGIISTFGLALFPFLLPSTTHLNASLTIWDASSSQRTLFLMLLATIILLPLITFYTSWVYYVLRGKTTVTEDGHEHY